MAEGDNSKNKNPMAMGSSSSSERVPALDPLFVPVFEPEQRVKKGGMPPLLLSSSSSTSSPAILSLGGGITAQTGQSFTPYVITVNTGEDVADMILEVAKNCYRSVCVLFADGSISSVVLGKPGSSRNETLRCEGRFPILSLTGLYNFVPGDDDAHRKIGWLNVQLAESDGSAFGGTIGGPLIAAEPVNLVLASFKLSTSKETLRRNTAGSSSVADLPRNLEIELEKVPEDDLMVEGKQSCPSTSGLLPTTDKPPEKVTSETTVKPPEHVTAETSDESPENVSCCLPLQLCIRRFF